MARRRAPKLTVTPLEGRSTPASLYTVNSAADTNARDGLLTLREALLAERGGLVGLDAGEAAQVQASAPGLTRDTVRFAAALGGQTIIFTTNDTAAVNRYGPTGFVVTTAVGIDGAAGTGRGVTLSGGGGQRLFAVTSTGDLTLTNLELVNGQAKGGAGGSGANGAAGLGGAVFVDQGRLTVSASTFAGNQAVGGAGGSGSSGGGGGLAGAGAGVTGGGPNGGTQGLPGGFGGGGGGGQLGGRTTTILPRGGGFGGGGGGGFGGGSVNNGSFRVIVGGVGGFGGGGTGSRTTSSSQDRAGFGGGAPQYAVAVDTFAGIAGGGGGGMGGAVFNNAGTVSVTASTFTANAAVGGAGGAVSAGYGGAVGGAGNGYGGAIFSRNGALTITASTLSANTAADGGASVAALADAVLGGGGDTVNTGTAALTLTNSILGQASAAGSDLVAITNGAGAVVTATGTANLIRTTAVTTVGSLAFDPQLGPLQDNGGPTRTMLPAAGGLAVNAVVGGTGTDQRGTPRADGLLDLGAVEVQNPSPGGTATLKPTTLPNGTTSLAYQAAVTAAGPFGPWTFAVTSGTLPPGLTLPTAGPFAHTTYLSGTPTTPGTYTFQITATNGGAATAQTYTVVIAPSVGPAALADALRGTPYAVTLAVLGSPGATTFAVTTGTLPAGLSLSAAGALTGTPSVGGTFAFTVTATTAAYGPVRRDYTLVVNYPPVTIAPDTLPAGQVGSAYSQTITATGGSGGPFLFVTPSGSLPPGLSLSTAGALKGTPTTAGTFTFTVTADGSVGPLGTRTYSLTLNAPAVTVGPAGLPNGQAGTAYAQTLTASGGAGGPYTFAVTTGTLPGLTLTTGGVLSGTPTVAGTFMFTATATAADGRTGTRDYSLVVVPPVTISPATLPGGRASVAYNQTLTATGPAGPYTFAVASGGLPPGLALSPAGLLAGTPTAEGNFTFTVAATSAAGWAGSRTYTVPVGPAPAVSVGPAALPYAEVGTAYAQVVTAAGEAAPYTFAVTTGALPPGLALTATGQLAGTPTTAGSYPFSITATSADGFAGRRDYTVAVYPPVSITPATLPAGQVGTPYAQTLTASGGAGGPFAFVAGALPPGLSLSTAGVLSGTPATAGTFAFTVTATAAGGRTGTQDYSLAVVPPVTIAPATLLGGRLTLAYDQTLTASGPAGPYTFAVTTGTLPPGFVLSAAGRITGTPGALGESTVTVTATSGDGWTGTAGYTINVGPAPLVTVSPDTLPDPQVGTPYDQTLTAAGEAAPYTFAVTGSLPPGLSLSSGGRLTGTPTAAGPYSFTVTATSADPFVGGRDYAVVVQPPVTVGPILLPDDVVTVPYDQVLTASGPAGPYTFAVAAGTLPPGLTLSDAGRLTGTPTAIGNYTFTVTATSADGYAGRRDYAVAIVAPGVVTIRPITLPDAQVGTSYGQLLTASGEVGPFTFAVTAGGLPPGLTLSTTGGEITGTPTAPGPYPFTVRATSGHAFSADQPLEIDVVPPVRVVTNLPSARQGVPYAGALTAAGPAGPYTFALTGGALPPGLTLSPGGAVTGVPAAAGNYTFTVTATTAAGWVGTLTVPLPVGPAPAVTVGPAALPDTQVGADYDQTITAAGEAAPYAFAVSGTLPPGLAISDDGRLTGTPTAVGSYAFSVTATSADGFAGRRDYTVVVHPPVTIAPATLPAGQAGTPYAQTLTAAGGAGGPFTFVVATGALPPGLTLSDAGVLSGTPTAAGPYSFTVTATSAGGLTGSRVYPLTIAFPPLVATPSGGSAGQVGTPFSLTLTASGGGAGRTCSSPPPACRRGWPSRRTGLWPVRRRPPDPMQSVSPWRRPGGWWARSPSPCRSYRR